jgi:tetratricopeptide (TPR) repeat protein
MMVFIALIGWIPLALMLFAVLPARRAMVVGAVAAWLLLPPVAIDLQGLPPLSKATVATVGILLGTLVFDVSRFLAFRPRWFDLPMLLFCLCPYASSISNGLGDYDGMAAAYRQIVLWLLPYLIGRLYLTDADGFRELAMGMIVGSLCMIPFCLLEMRIGAQLQRLIYGMGAFEGMRYGLYRPALFLNGLELGLWLNATTLMAWWLRRCGLFKRLWGLSAGSVVLILVISSILFRATGATVLIATGFFALWFCTKIKTKWVMWGLVVIAPTYYYVRITNLWTGRDAVELIRTHFSEERAQSLEARLWEDDLLIARGLKRPAFGWGGYNRSRIMDDDSGNLNPRMLPAVDALWTIVFGTTGYTGLVTMTIALTLPVVLFLVRFPVGRWDHPDLAAVTVFAMILTLFLLDSLFNAMLNAIYLIAAGGLVNIVPARIGPRASDRAGGARTPVARSPGGPPVSPAPGTMSGRRGETIRSGAIVEVATRSLLPGEDLAARYQALGRASKDRGQPTEAKAAWQHALDLLTELTAAHPERPALRQRWCDCANDLAWLLVSAPNPAVQDPARAVALAVKAAEAHPECSTYWNTLGAAHYRAGDFEAAVSALDRATALGNGGTAFDHIFLAMAHAQLGNPADARRWFAQATLEIERDQPGHPELRRLCEEAGAILPADILTSEAAR